MSTRTVRISGGELKGRTLLVPASIRPSPARLREALFDIWQSRIRDAVVFDLFAGSGAIGVEALSRGARTVVFVESDRSVLETLRQNIRIVPAALTLVVEAELPKDLERITDRLPATADLIFADPPYGFAEYEELVAAVVPLLAPDGDLTIEHRDKTELPERIGELKLSATRRYGDSRLSSYCRR